MFIFVAEMFHASVLLLCLSTLLMPSSYFRTLFPRILPVSELICYQPSGFGSKNFHYIDSQHCLVYIVPES